MTPDDPNEVKFDAQPLPVLYGYRAGLARLMADLEDSIARKLQAAPVDAEPDRLLTAPEVAALLGTTTDHIWALMRHGKLPCISVGKKYRRVPLSAVQALMAGRPLPPVTVPPGPRLRTPRMGRTPAASLPK